ncbi:MAG: T9SS type A sorting domain-containing protein, partial [Bacteroidota bacterium]
MKKILLFIIGILCSLQISGQVMFDGLVSSSGDCYETNIVLYSWSLGECMVETLVDNSKMLNQGFHQPFLIDKEHVVDTRYKDLSVNVHPNPATNYIEIKISKELDPLERCFIEIYDLNGKGLLKKEILSHNETINLSSFNRKSLIL